MERFEDLLGKTLKSVENYGNEQLIFTIEDGESYRLYHEQDCCENVEIEDIAGELSDLVGSPILMAEEVTNEQETPEGLTVSEYAESYTWTFYKLATIKGYVTIRWFGSSNGYYSERVSWGRAA